jgi:hypothetical protein
MLVEKWMGEGRVGEGGWGRVEAGGDLAHFLSVFRGENERPTHTHSRVLIAIFKKFRHFDDTIYCSI